MNLRGIAATGQTPFDSWIRKASARIRRSVRKKSDAIDNIERLYDLLKIGAITQAEFDELKAILKKEI